MDDLKVWNFKQYQVSEVTLEVLKSLVEKRQKEQKFEQLLLKWSLSLFVILFFAILYIYFYKLPAIESMFMNSRKASEYFMQDMILFVLFIVGVLCFIQMFLYKKKHVKAEGEYEELRIATIDRGEELWEKPVPWQHRHEVFEWLKKEHDVNLYHK